MEKDVIENVKIVSIHLIQLLTTRDATIYRYIKYCDISMYRSVSIFRLYTYTSSIL